MIYLFRKHCDEQNIRTPTHTGPIMLFPISYISHVITITLTVTIFH